MGSATRGSRARPGLLLCLWLLSFLVITALYELELLHVNDGLLVMLVAYAAGVALARRSYA
jgi:hypothetical protein